LFITAKTFTKLNLGHGDKVEIKFKKPAVVIHILQTTQNLIWSFHVVVFAEDSKEMYQELQRTRTAIVLLIKSFV